MDWMIQNIEKISVIIGLLVSLIIAVIVGIKKILAEINTLNIKNELSAIAQSKMIDAEELFGLNSRKKIEYAAEQLLKTAPVQTKKLNIKTIADSANFLTSVYPLVKPVLKLLRFKK